MSGFTKDMIAVVQAGGLSQAIAAGGRTPKYLGVGEHEVHITGVDRNQLADNKLTVKFADAAGLEHNERMYVMEQNRKTGAPELSWKIVKLLAAVLPHEQALHAFSSEWVANNPEVLDLLIGLECRLSLKHGRGYRLDYNREVGEYVAADTQTGQEYGRSKSVEALKATVEAEGVKRAYLNVDRFGALHGDDNVRKFEVGLAAMRQPKTGPAAFQVGKMSRAV